MTRPGIEPRSPQVKHLYPVMVNRIRTSDSYGLNKGCSLKFCIGSRVRQTPEEGQRAYRPKRCDYNKDKDSSQTTLNNKNQQALFDKCFTICTQFNRILWGKKKITIPKNCLSFLVTSSTGNGYTLMAYNRKVVVLPSRCIKRK